MAEMATLARRQPRTGFRLPARARRGASDEQVATIVAGGDEAAFAKLVERHQSHLLGFCRHMLGRAADAEDAVQHSFMALLVALREGKKPEFVRAWLYTVARNRCISMLRARRDGPAIDAVELSATEGLSDALVRREDLRALLRDIAVLPEDQRAALLLAELGDLSHREIAQVIEVPETKVKALVFQARQALIAASSARELPCESVREELATASGAALRRKHLRRHVDGCEGCRTFESGVRDQHRAFALILPVIPTLALREGILGSLLGGGASAGAAGGLASGGAGALLSSGVAKTLVCVVAGASVVAGGDLATRSQGSAAAPSAIERSQSPSIALQPGAIVPAGFGLPVGVIDDDARTREGGKSNGRSDRGQGDRGGQRGPGYKRSRQAAKSLRVRGRSGAAPARRSGPKPTSRTRRPAEPRRSRPAKPPASGKSPSRRSKGTRPEKSPSGERARARQRNPG